MQEQIFHIPFNRSQFIKSQKDSWRFSTRQLFKSYLTYSILAILFFAINFKIDSFGQVIAVGFLFYMTLAWVGFIERRIKFFKLIKAYANRYESMTMNCMYIFNDEGIEYRDSEKLYQLKWHLFKPFEAYKQTIYLKLKDQSAVIFSLNQQELGETGYNELYKILEEKIG
jgi:hypothetical protein